MKQEQHFVPKYYFRMFSGRERSISALLKKSGKLIDRASISVQCARPYFYGKGGVESALSQIESKHAHELRRIVRESWDPISAGLDEQMLMSLWQSLILQRFRSELDVEKNSEHEEDVALEMFRFHLEHDASVDPAFREEALRAIAVGEVKVAKDRTATAIEQVTDALHHTLLISDLHWCVLRNRTEYPFVFGDAPVIFYNSWAFKVKNRGVLGLQCPGLQIFFPLNPRTLVMMYDPDKYRGPFLDSWRFDVVHPSDVSQLNILQVFHSLVSVFAAEPSHLQYVDRLWKAVGSPKDFPRRVFDKKSGLLVDGKRPDGPLYHMFERQIDFRVDLTFVNVERVRERDYHFVPRDLAIHREEKLKSAERARQRRRDH